jgi:hypothetical protein
MGQYYKAIIGHKDGGNFIIDAIVDPWECEGNGSKLMEHSYIGNAVTAEVEYLLGEGGKLEGKCLVWAGDYAENEPGKDVNLWDIADNSPQDKFIADIKERHFRYALNKTKKVAVDMDNCIADKYGLKIFPVSLLCAEGNGQGGGDYYGINDKYVGTWARDEISFSNTLPPDYKILNIHFRENRQ